MAVTDRSQEGIIPLHPSSDAIVKSPTSPLDSQLRAKAASDMASPAMSPCKSATSTTTVESAGSLSRKSPTSFTTSSQPSATPKVSRCTKSKAAPGLRRGKWIAEEEQYCTKIIQYFKLGYIPLEEGTSLRNYLADKLNCEPMRITKKFVGSECIGKQMYHPPEVTEELEEKRRQALAELSELELKFKQRLEQISAKSAAKLEAGLGNTLSSRGGGPAGFGGLSKGEGEDSSSGSENIELKLLSGAKGSGNFISRKRPLDPTTKSEVQSYPSKSKISSSKAALKVASSISQMDLDSAKLLMNFSLAAHNQQRDSSTPTEHHRFLQTSLFVSSAATAPPSGTSLQPQTKLPPASSLFPAGASIFRQPSVISKRSKRPPPVLKPLDTPLVGV